MSSPLHISILPEEMLLNIASHLEYYDSWSLKQTSRRFYRVVEIPTVESFFANPDGTALNTLEKWNVVPEGYDPCCYCRRFLTPRHFSRDLRKKHRRNHPGLLLKSEDGTFDFCYTKWNPESEFCLDCGVKYRKYEWGRPIRTGFGDAGYTKESVVPCLLCGVLLGPYRKFSHERHWACEGCLRIVFGDHRSDMLDGIKNARLFKSKVDDPYVRRLLNISHLLCHFERKGAKSLHDAPRQYSSIQQRLLDLRYNWLYLLSFEKSEFECALNVLKRRRDINHGTPETSEAIILLVAFYTQNFATFDHGHSPGELPLTPNGRNFSYPTDHVLPLAQGQDGDSASVRDASYYNPDMTIQISSDEKSSSRGTVNIDHQVEEIRPICQEISQSAPTKSCGFFDWVKARLQCFSNTSRPLEAISDNNQI